MIFESTAQERFGKELQVALLGNDAFEPWRNTGIDRLQSTCSYLIETRGFGGWKG
nr:hypothetical protein [Pseudopedobacter sp.]